VGVFEGEYFEADYLVEFVYYFEDRVLFVADCYEQLAMVKIVRHLIMLDD